MHDPMTVCWRICLPFGKSYEYPVLTVWHVDPEKDGSDDSCSWFLPKLSKKEQALAHDLTNNEIDNLQSWFSDQDAREVEWKVARIMRVYKREFRWRWHPRWHFWHWQFQFHPWQWFYRQYFERCDVCGEKLKGETPIGNWGGTKKWHQSCDEAHIKVATAEAQRAAQKGGVH